METKPNINCLRCGKPYSLKATSNGPEYDFDGHICEFREKEDNPFETGVVGRETITIRGLENFVRNYQHIYAGAYNNKGSKRITIGFDGHYQVYNGNQLICRTTDLEKAVTKYNLIVLTPSEKKS